MLRGALLMMALFAAPVFAEDVAPDAHWRECDIDADCVAVQGTCDLTSVNLGYKDDAAAYYRKLHQKANCVEKFWQPKKGMIPECKPLAGSKADKDAEVVPHNACAMVPKPADNTKK